MSLVPQAVETANQNWNAIIALNSLEETFAAKYATVNAENVLRFMVGDTDNYASIHSCLRLARENAHAVRGTITTEMWETLNSTWLEAREKTFEQLYNAGIADFFEWVKMRSSLSRGTTLGTLLQDESFHFIRLGTLLERADNTARILDVKYHILLPSIAEVGGVADYYHWGALLRSVAAFESYRKAYRDLITPKRVTELLVLRADMPRSLAACIHEVNRLVQEINGPRSSELARRCGRLSSELRFGNVDEIFAQGLHEYLTEFLACIYDLGALINTTYFWSTDE